MSVYRRPFDYSAHIVARVEWQPQPSWTFECSTAYWLWTEHQASVLFGITCTTASWEWSTGTGTITVAGAILVDANPSLWEWSTFRATVAASKEIDCSASLWEWNNQFSTVGTTPLTIAVTAINAYVRQSSMTERASSNQILARVA